MARRPRRPGGARRLLAIFAVSVFLPALGLSALAYRSVAQERRALSAEREGKLRRAGWSTLKQLVSSIDEVRRVEEGRPYYHYHRWFYDPTSQGGGVNFVLSPIAEEPVGFISAYFQIDPDGRVVSPNDPIENKPQPSPKERRQQDRTRQAKDEVAQELLPKVRRDAVLEKGQPQGQFPGVAEAGKKQMVSRKGILANTKPEEKLKQIADGKQVEIESQGKELDEEVLEVVVSPFLFERTDEGGVRAFRYVDVPNESKAFDGRPFLRFVQGFRLDMEYLRTLARAQAWGYIDRSTEWVELVGDGEEAPAGEVVFWDTTDLLPGYRLVVTDTDTDWVSRRVARFAVLVLGGAAGLLLVIAGGLFFTLRAVRSEVRLARRKSDFVASVTHELRTPLTGIKMYADMLQAGWVKDESTREEYIDFMAGETDRLTRLVNRVLDFARSERGETPVAPVVLAGPIGEVEKSFGPFIAENGFELRLELEEEVVALADSDAVKQILLNLLENGVKYAKGAGDRTLHVRLGREGEHAVLSVADHGPGVPPEERDRVFADFYRPGEELTRETAGTGLGLALVRRLTESMGGKVELTETPGGGATFRILLRSA
ncbi:MAG: sensor histidine kinase [Planctomycetota bacterium]|jgi:signal transduction histidine kinase